MREERGRGIKREKDREGGGGRRRRIVKGVSETTYL